MCSILLRKLESFLLELFMFTVNKKSGGRKELLFTNIIYSNCLSSNHIFAYILNAPFQVWLEQILNCFVEKAKVTWQQSGKILLSEILEV
jgi:hypothetical protein